MTMSLTPSVTVGVVAGVGVTRLPAVVARLVYNCKIRAAAGLNNRH